MKNYIVKNIINLKFIFITLIVFIAVGTIAKKELMFLGTIPRVSIGDSLLYSFNLIGDEGISIDFIKVITIYISLFYLIIGFISRYLTDMKYFYLLRIGSYKKYMLQLIIYTYGIIFIYFLCGYIIILLINNNFDFTINYGFYINLYNGIASYLETIIWMFIFNNVIVMSFANLIIAISIYSADLKKSIITTFLIFFMGALGIAKFIPGYHIFLFRNLTNTGFFVYKECIIYIIFILLSLISIFYFGIKKKDFILYEYNL